MVVRIAIAATVIGFLVLLVGVVGRSSDEASPASFGGWYEIEFGTVGDGCRDSDALIIDAKNGDELDCGPSVPIAGSTKGDFTSVETDEVLALAEQLAADGELSSAEQDEISALGTAIAERHKPDLPAEEPPINGFGYAKIAGTVLFILGVMLLAGWGIIHDVIRRR